MLPSANEFSRVGKFFVDRDGLMPEDALTKLSSRKVVLVCGPEVASSLISSGGFAHCCKLGKAFFQRGGSCETAMCRYDSPLHNTRLATDHKPSYSGCYARN